MEAPVVLKYGPPERVHVENEWYDGPRAGVADVDGIPHRFKSIFDEAEGRYLETFLVWPIDEKLVALEVEQWRIFVEWNVLYEAAEVGVDSHPGHGGRSRRWDEIEALLTSNRSEVPALARRAIAQLSYIDGTARYGLAGPAYMLAWCLL